MPLPCTTPATISDLRAGQCAAIFPDCALLQRIRRVSPAPRGGVRVEWDNGLGSRATVRVMPGTNPVQIAWES